MNLNYVEVIRAGMDKALRALELDFLLGGAEQLQGLSSRMANEPARFFGIDSEAHYQLRLLADGWELNPNGLTIEECDAQYAKLSDEQIRTDLSEQLRLLAEYARLGWTLVNQISPGDIGSYFDWIVDQVGPLAKRDMPLIGLERVDFWATRLLDNLSANKTIDFDFLGRLDSYEGFVTDEWDLQARNAAYDSPALALFGHYAQVTDVVFDQEFINNFKELLESLSVADRLNNARTDMAETLLNPLVDILRGQVFADATKALNAENIITDEDRSLSDKQFELAQTVVLAFTKDPNDPAHERNLFEGIEDEDFADGFAESSRDLFITDPPDFTILADVESRVTFMGTYCEEKGLAKVAANRVRVTPDNVYKNLRDFTQAVRARYDNTATVFDNLNEIERSMRAYAHISELCEVDDPSERAEIFARATGDDPIAEKYRADILYFTIVDSRRDQLQTAVIAPEINTFKGDLNSVLDDLINSALSPISDSLSPALNVGDKASFETALGHVEDLKNAGADVRAVIEQKIAVWPAMRDAQMYWRRLARDGIYQDYVQSLIYKVEHVVTLGLRALATVAVTIPSFYRCIDQTISRGDKDMFDEQRSIILKFQLKSNVALWGRVPTTKSDRLPDLMTVLFEPLKEIADNSELYEVFDNEFKNVVAYVNSFERYLPELVRFEEYLIRIVGDAFDVTTALSTKTLPNADDDMRLRRVFSFIKTIANAEPRLNLTLTDLFKDLAPLKLAIAAGFDEWLLEVKYNHGVDFLELAHHSRASTNALKSCARRVFAAALQNRIKLTRNKDNDNSHDYATLEIAQLFLDAERDFIDFADMSAEWPDAHARAWEHVWQRDQNVDPTQRKVRQVAATLSDFQNAWFDDGRSLSEIADEMETSKAAKQFQICARVLANAEPYIAAYCIEEIPPFLREISARSGTPTTAPSFLNSHIVDFKFHNELAQTKLSSLVAQEMILELINPLGEPFTLGKPIPAPVPDEDLQLEDKTQPECHFILRFRRGALDDVLDNIALIAPKTPQGDWMITGRRQVTYDAIPVDELLIAGPTGLAFKAGQSRHLILTEMQGAGGETRTTRVLLLHQAIEDQFNGSREKLLTIMNDIPRNTRQVFELPLHVEFVKSDSAVSDPAGALRNDGISFNKLRLELTSVVPMNHRTQVAFSRFRHHGKTASGASLDTFRRTKIIVSVDTVAASFGEHKDWAMCNTSAAQSMQMSLQDADRQFSPWDLAFTSQGTRAEWIFTPPHPTVFPEEAMELRRDQSLILDMNRIQTALPSGPCNIYLDCRNFPGFPDRTFLMKANKYPGDVPAGTIIAFSGRDLPKGWLFCHGQDVPDGEDYTALRAARHDPDNPDETAKIPNLVARTLIGSGPKAKRTNDTGSDAFPTIAADQKVQMVCDQYDGQWETPLEHDHLPDHIHNNTMKWNVASGWTANEPDHRGRALYNGGIETPPAGSELKNGNPHVNFQPYYSTNYIIKI